MTDSAFLNLQKGKDCNRTDLKAYTNYECDRLCFILEPLRGKINLEPRPQNKIFVPFRGSSQNIRRAFPSRLLASPALHGTVEQLNSTGSGLRSNVSPPQEKEAYHKSISGAFLFEMHLKRF